KVHSTWASPNTTYEDAVLAFVDGALDPEASKTFLAAFLPFEERVARLAIHNSLVQTTLKLTVPGVPDIYQGADLWDLSLVDPDNRRPVDYECRVRLLEQSAATPMRELLARWQDGAVKLQLTSKILAFRAADAELFARGEYEPLPATGPKADLICAFARRNGERSAIIMTARFPARLEADPDWSGTAVALPQHLAGKTWRNVLTGAVLQAGEASPEAGLALDGLPIAVFAAD
ncbi:MAG: (1-_4)-alpha-D-glucan 1-alpha-D-glucosylmutase, partial [Bryobacterales bacterium]|nr:(1->4)-alpha-D-glucan 1-alpha-D-glucosylmutase [Bryobacterales bacterium]